MDECRVRGKIVCGYMDPERSLAIVMHERSYVRCNALPCAEARKRGMVVRCGWTTSRRGGQLAWNEIKSLRVMYKPRGDVLFSFFVQVGFI